MTARFPDAEQFMVDLLTPFGYACTFLPVNDEGKFDESRMPIIWVTRNGGTRDDITDRPIMSVAVFAKTRKVTNDIAEQCREAVLDAPGNVKVGGVFCDYADEVTAPSRAEDIDPTNRLVQASFRLSFRRQKTI